MSRQIVEGGASTTSIATTIHLSSNVLGLVEGWNTLPYNGAFARAHWRLGHAQNPKFQRFAKYISTVIRHCMSWRDCEESLPLGEVFDYIERDHKFPREFCDWVINNWILFIH